MKHFAGSMIGLIALLVAAIILGNSVPSTVSRVTLDAGCYCMNNGFAIYVNGTGNLIDFPGYFGARIESGKSFTLLVSIEQVNHAGGILRGIMTWMPNMTDNARFTFDPQEVRDNSPQDRNPKDGDITALFRITAPKEPGSYSNYLFTQAGMLSIAVTVKPDMYYLDMSTEPAGVTDMAASGWFAQGSSVSITPVPTEVQGANGTKYVFTGWTVDGAPRAGNGFVIIMDLPHKVVAKYETMFMLTVLSDYGNPKGAGYYRSGETAKFSVDSPVGVFGIQQAFVEWKGDYVGKNPNGSISMDGPKTVTAVWTRDHFQIYLIVAGIGAIVAVVAVLLLLIKRRHGSFALKPPPSATSR